MAKSSALKLRGRVRGVSLVFTNAHGGAMQLETVLAAAMEAAAARASRRAKDVIMVARLATASHMRQVAEPTVAPAEHLIRAASEMSREPEASQTAVRARLMRREGGQ